MKIQANSLYLALCLSFPLAITPVFLTGCASDQHNVGPSTLRGMDDQSLRLQITTALGDNPDYKFEGVSVTVSDGVVRLGGFVDGFAQKVKAGDIITQVPGVKDIVDNIAVKKQDASSPGESADDKSLTESVKSILDNNPEYKYADVNVAAFQGTVQLSGFVETADQKNRASDLARAVPGVKDVMNNITVKAIL